MLPANAHKKIGLVGGGPAALFMYKRLVDSGEKDLHISIFEKQDRLGAGMPYGEKGACMEHITNVSGNEIPELVTSMESWIQTAPAELLQQFEIRAECFNDYKVVPRLLFGEYLQAQFTLLHKEAQRNSITTEIFYNTPVTDIEDNPEIGHVKLFTKEKSFIFDAVVICTGHTFPKENEGKVEGWFDSPYPPAKLAGRVNYPVAIKGSSLTAIDAVRTLARENGSFQETGDGQLRYQVTDNTRNFRMVLHSLGGFLPAIRFHLNDTHLTPAAPLSEKEIYQVADKNDGFVPLNYLFKKNFLQPVQQQDPDFYEQIKHMSIEEFVDYMMDVRERLDAFTLFKAEYAEAEISIKRRESVIWKETLAALSYAMNYPAKHMSAEDILRLKKVLMPLISIVIAFVPQGSCREMIALHEAGILSVVAVDKESTVTPGADMGAVYRYQDENGAPQEIAYHMYIDAAGQPPMMFNDFPFETLKNEGAVSAARLKFKSAELGEREMKTKVNPVEKDEHNNYYLQVPGISINDNFQVLDKYGVFNSRIYIMAVPFIGGLNPDYSGLDFCETASEKIVNAMLQKEPVLTEEND